MPCCHCTYTGLKDAPAFTEIRAVSCLYAIALASGWKMSLHSQKFGLEGALCRCMHIGLKDGPDIWAGTCPLALFGLEDAQPDTNI